MKILYIGFFSLPDNDASANRVFNNAKALRASGHEVLFIDEQRELECSNLEDSLHDVQGFSTWSLRRPKSAIQFVKKMLGLNGVDIVSKKIKGIDLIIAYNYPAISLERIRRMAQKRGIKVVADCTEWYSGKEYSFPMNYLCAIDSFCRMQIVQKKLDGIISISSYLNNFYRANNSVFVPPLIDVNEEKWKANKYQWDRDKINLIYAGNPGKNKENLLPIVETIYKLQRKELFRLRIVGIDRNIFLDLYPNTLNILNELGDIIQFYGRVSHKENLQLVKASDFLIFIREKNRVNQAGFSTKFVEAVTLGTYVITTDTGDLKEYIDLLKCGETLDSVEQLQQVLENIDVDKVRKYNQISKNKTFDYTNYIEIFNQWLSKL